MLNLKSHLLDYFVILLYILGIFWLAQKASKQTNQSNDVAQDKYLANKSLTFFESICSIIATEVSALTFLGIPAFAYGSDYSFVQIYFGAIIGRFILGKYLLPHIYDKGLTLYSVMKGETGTSNGQLAVALFYSINKILSVGVRLFSGSILIAEFFNTNIFLAVTMISSLTFFYTLIGGLKAVVRTDIAQLFLFTFGGLLAHFVIPHVADTSWTELMQMAIDANKTLIFNPLDPSAFIIGVMGGFLFDLGTHGVDQDYIQRLTANQSMRGGRLAIQISAYISILIALLFLSIGSLLWSYYQLHPAPNMANDKLFAHFIVTYFPAGLKGLMIAGVLAATMSTLDSTINALSATLYSDIFSHKTTQRKNIERIYKWDTFIITLTLTLVSFVAAQSSGLLVFGLTITSWTAGSLFAIFLSTVISRKYFKMRLSAPLVVGSYMAGIFCVFMNYWYFKLNWQLNVYFGFIGTMTFIFLYKNLKKVHEA